MPLTPEQAAALGLEGPAPAAPASKSLTLEQAQALGLEPPAPAAPAGPTKLDSFKQGAAQGATMGFLDEIAGMVGQAFESTPVRWLRDATGVMEVPKDAHGNVVVPQGEEAYKSYRDEARSISDEARKANPLTYGAGGLVGGVAAAAIPGVGAARGLTMGGAALRGAGAGAIGGLGSSTADLTTDAGQQEAVADVLQGAVMGAAFGAGGQAVGNRIGSLVKRARESTGRAITEGAQNTTITRELGKATPAGHPGFDKFAAEMNKLPAMRRLMKGGDSQSAYAIAARKADEAGEAVGSLWSKLDDGSPGISVEAIDDKLVAIAKRFATPGGPDKSAAKFVQGVADDLMEAHGPGAMLRMKDLHNLTSEWGALARSKNFGPPTDKQLAARDVWLALKQLGEGEAERIAAARPELGVSLDAMKAANSLYGAWAAAENMLREAASRAATGAETGKSLFKSLGKKAVAAASDAVDYYGGKAIEAVPGAQKALNRVTPYTAVGAGAAGGRLGAQDIGEAIAAALGLNDQQRGR